MLAQCADACGTCEAIREPGYARRVLLRLLENSQRVSRARAIASVAVGLCLIYAAPTYGWWLVGLFAVSALNTQTLELADASQFKARVSRRVQHPDEPSVDRDRRGVHGWIRSAILPLVAVPTAFAATRFLFTRRDCGVWNRRRPGTPGDARATPLGNTEASDWSDGGGCPDDRDFCCRVGSERCRA